MTQVPDGQDLQETLASYLDPGYIPHAAVDVTLPRYGRNTDIKSLHAASMELMARLDSQSLNMMGELQASLGELQRTEKKVSYQVDLVKSDVEAFRHRQTEFASRALSTLEPELQNRTLVELSELDVIKTRMCSVQKLLEEARDFDEVKLQGEISSLISNGELAAAQSRVAHLQQVADLWAGTPGYEAHRETVAKLRKTVDGGAKAV